MVAFVLDPAKLKPDVSFCPKTCHEENLKEEYSWI